MKGRNDNQIERLESTHVFLGQAFTVQQMCGLSRFPRNIFWTLLCEQFISQFFFFSLVHVFVYNPKYHSLMAQAIKNMPEMPRFDPYIGKIPWRRAWKPTPVFFLGEFHGQRSLAGNSPWGCKSRTLLK